MLITLAWIISGYFTLSCQSSSRAKTFFQLVWWSCVKSEEISNQVWKVSFGIFDSATDWLTDLSQQTSQWLEILQRLCLHNNPRIQHRGLVIVYNMLNSDDSELAKKLIESEMLEILSVIGKAEDNPKRQEAIDVARTCLVKAMDLDLIKPFTGPSWMLATRKTAAADILISSVKYRLKDRLFSKLFFHIQDLTNWIQISKDNLATYKLVLFFFTEAVWG